MLRLNGAALERSSQGRVFRRRMREQREKVVDLPRLTSEQLRIMNVEPVGYSQEARQIYEKLGHLEEGPVSRLELMSIVSKYDVILVRLTHQIDKDILERAQRLRVIVTPTTGLDHIDLDAA